MSRLCRLKSYKSIGEDGLWAYNEIIQLRATITEQAARIKALEDALRVCKETLMHYQYGGSNYKKPADKAIAAINELIGE